jgi:hypothetical protein
MSNNNPSISGPTPVTLTVAVAIPETEKFELEFLFLLLVSQSVSNEIVPRETAETGKRVKSTMAFPVYSG